VIQSFQPVDPVDLHNLPVYLLSDISSITNPEHDPKTVPTSTLRIVLPDLAFAVPSPEPSEVTHVQSQACSSAGNPNLVCCIRNVGVRSPLRQRNASCRSASCQTPVLREVCGADSPSPQQEAANDCTPGNPRRCQKIGLASGFLAVLFLLGALHAQTFMVQGPSDFPHDRNPRELAQSMKHERDWKFAALTLAAAATAGIDAYQTSTGWRETSEPWLYGTHPSEHRGQLALTIGGEVLVSTLASRWLRHRNSRFWALPESVVLQAHTRGAVHNFRKGIF